MTNEYSAPSQYGPTYVQLQQEVKRLQSRLEELEMDAARLDYLEKVAKYSRSGVSVDWAKYSEDGYVLERGYRVMSYHTLYERKPSIRLAIDAAMQSTKEQK